MDFWGRQGSYKKAAENGMNLLKLLILTLEINFWLSSKDFLHSFICSTAKKILLDLYGLIMEGRRKIIALTRCVFCII